MVINYWSRSDLVLYDPLSCHTHAATGICLILTDKTVIGNSSYEALGFCDRASWANCEVREKTNKMQQLDVYFLFLTISQHVSGIIMPIFRRTRRMLLHVVCCAGSAGCGWLRLWGAAL